MYVECKYYSEWVYVKDFYNSIPLSNTFPKRTCIDMNYPGATKSKEQLSTDEILSFDEWCKKVNISYPFNTYNKVKCIYSNTLRFNKDIIYDCKGNGDYFKYQGIQYSLIQKNYRFVPVIKIKSKKKLITDLNYPDVIHIKSKNEYNKIKKYIKLTKYSSTHNWVLIKNRKQYGRGMNKYTGQAFNGKNYVNYEFEDLIFPKEDFILPERWAIKVTTENAKMLGKFYGKHAFEGYEKIIPEQEIGKYYTSHNVWSDNSVFSTNPGSNFDIETLTTKYREYEEITTEQFKKYVLDKMKPEKDIIKVFNRFNIGDIVVSMNDIGHNTRMRGTICKVLKYSSAKRLYYHPIDGMTMTHSTAYNDWRLATPEEIKFYNSGGKNINDMKNKFDKLLATDLKKGQYYYIKTISTEWISIFEEIKNGIVYDTACIAISGNFYRKGYVTNGWGKVDDYIKNIRLATQEEKAWLNTCIMIDGLISKETALEIRSENKEFKKDDYIVLVSSEFSMSGFTIDYCYKVREDGKYLTVYKDNKSIENGYYACQFDNTGKIKWREATKKEIIEYDRLDKPYNTVNLILKKQEIGSNELLAKAIKNYPVGTFYIPAHLADNDDYYQKVYEDQTIVIEGNSIYLKNKSPEYFYKHPKSNNGYDQVLYDGNTDKWARIIPKPENTILRANTGKFKKGDKVKVVRAAKSYEGDWNLSWVSIMDYSIKAIVTIDDSKDREGYSIKENDCIYPEFVLELVSKADKNNPKENFKHFHSLETRKIIPIIVKINK